MENNGHTNSLCRLLILCVLGLGLSGVRASLVESIVSACFDVSKTAVLMGPEASLLWGASGSALKPAVHKASRAAQNGTILCVLRAGTKSCYTLPGLIYQIKASNTDSGMEQVWILPVDHQLHESFRAWLKQQSPPDVSDWFASQQSWWRGDIELSVDYSRSIISSESELPGSVRNINFTRLVATVTDVDGQLFFQFRDNQRIMGDYEFRQFLALMFEWFLERMLSYSFRPYVSVRATGDDYVRQVSGRRKKGQGKPRAGRGNKSGAQKHKKGTVSDKTPVIKETMKTGPQLPATIEPTIDLAVPVAGKAGSNPLSQVDKQIGEEKFDQAINGLLVAYARLKVTGETDQSAEGEIGRRINRAVQGKLEHVIKPMVNGKPALGQLQVAVTQASLFYLIPDELFNDITRRWMSKWLLKYGDMALGHEFEQFDLTDDSPGFVRHHAERIYLHYRLALSASHLEFVARQWFRATGVLDQAAQFLHSNKPVQALHLLASQPLMFNEFARRLQERARSEMQQTYQATVEQALTAMAAQSVNTQGDLARVGQLVRIHTRMPKATCLLEPATIERINDQLEMLIARQNSSASGQVVKINYVPLGEAAAKPVTVRGTNFIDLVTQVNGLIESGDNARALGMALAMMSHPAIEQVAVNELSGSLNMLLAPVIYQLSISANQQREDDNWQEQVRKLYAVTVDHRQHLSATLVNRLQWLENQLPEYALSVVDSIATSSAVNPPPVASGQHHSFEKRDNKGFTTVKRSRKKPQKDNEVSESECPAATEARTSEADFFKRYPQDKFSYNPASRYLPYEYLSSRESVPKVSTPNDSEEDEKTESLRPEKPKERKKSQPPAKNPWFREKSTATGKQVVSAQPPPTRTLTEEQAKVILHRLLKSAFPAGRAAQKGNFDKYSKFIKELEMEDPPTYITRFMNALALGTISVSDDDLAYMLLLDYKQLGSVIKKSEKSNCIERQW